MDKPQLRGVPAAPVDDGRTARRAARLAARHAERLVRESPDEPDVARAAVGPRGEQEERPVILGAVPDVGEDERGTWCRMGVGDAKG